ncbi:MAG: tripartite tricarboxylate transporter permease [Burkholderiaceae bacterium]|uniref:tripartite tricarboxylate transporter permease n=1 Tax=Hydrogenophaga sp. TaxID=1904254 RepID=UPI00276ABAC7|nr:tripartite tricarboxylate transporter permease [Hydrogenophaga sp.]MDP2065111.1 tripartite tricarboxylate transporter permease [Burkholderiaceae bacterium]MDZ4145920.1 tripartite tricarboxylate transporter permease [Burkholderiales bacterium]MDZ4400109.1 tripartite tricarboxylate transporter permease [Hydrogenophaga sp.]
MNEALSFFFMTWIDPKLLFLTAAGTFAGIYIGAIPGLSVTMAVSILISFTFKWDVNDALALISGIFLGGVYGGSRSAILLNIPGAPSAIATGLDGYPLAKRGEAGAAIGLTTVMSVFGGFIGILALAVAAPTVSSLALMFAPRDYLMLAIWGILLVGSLSGGSLAKGIFAGAFGVLIGSVGLDPMTAEPRFTFGNLQLTSGISYVAAMIGFFGVAEVLAQLHELKLKAVKQNVSKILPSWALMRKYLPLATRTSAIGVVVGALPGAGGDIAALMAYDHAKRTVKNPSRPFGEGAYEGLVAPESANNAAVGGAYIPMMTLGIPGDAVTAVIIGAMYIHGLKPGPLLMIETPHLFWFQVGALTLANFFLLIFGLTGIKMFAKIVETPKPILLPLILVLSAVGAYAISNNPVDVYWMLGFGVVGYFLKMYGFQVGPVILGMILGPLMDKSYRQAMISAEGHIGQFAGEFFTSPLSAIILAALTFTIVSQTAWWQRLRGRVGADRPSN